MLDVRKLSYFLAIVRAGSISGAAQALRIAQPALSHHIAQMEMAFGVKLFDRHARGVTLTETGRLLQSRAEKLVRELALTEELLRAQSDTPTGDVIVGVISSLAIPLTGPLLATTSRDLPRVRVYIKEGNSITLSRGLRENRIDLAVSLSGASAPSSEAIADEPLYLVSNRDMSPGCDEIRLSDALKLPLILGTRDHVHRTIIEGAASQLAISVNVAWEIDGHAMIRSAVLKGFGHTIMGRAAFEGDFTQDFRTCRIVQPELFRRIVLQRSEVRINQAIDSRITEVIHSLAEDLVQKGIWVPLAH